MATIVDADEAQSQPSTISVAGTVVGVASVSAELATSTGLWATWASIAVREEDAAHRARDEFARVYPSAGGRRPGAIWGPRVSQFFGSNPAARSPQGPKRGPWRRGVPRTWRDALDLPEAPDEPREVATGELQAPSSVSPAPSDIVDESSEQSFPSSDPPSWGPGLV